MLADRSQKDFLKYKILFVQLSMDSVLIWSASYTTHILKYRSIQSLWIADHVLSTTFPRLFLRIYTYSEIHILWIEILFIFYKKYLRKSLIQISLVSSALNESFWTTLFNTWMNRFTEFSKSRSFTSSQFGHITFTNYYSKTVSSGCSSNHQSRI